MNLKGKQKQLSMEQAIEIFTKISDCGIRQKDAVFCYGISKMTVANENGEFSAYQKMYFVEFLEMICRIADIKFKTGDLDKNMLHKNVENILDDMFVILGKEHRRREVSIEIEDLSQSDSDY